MSLLWGSLPSDQVLSGHAVVAGDGVVAHINLARGFRGGERQTLLLASELAGRGLRQRLVVRRGAELIDRAQGIDKLEVSTCTGVISAAIATRGSSLVHSHEGRSIQAATLASLMFGSPYVVTRRVMNPLSRNLVTAWMYRRAGARVALSNAIANALRSFDSRLTATVIPSALAAELPVAARVEELRANSASRLRIGNVAALEADSKGQWTLLAAARAMPEADFILVGSGRDGAALRAAAEPLNNVHFAGQVRDVASWLSSFDVFAFPSLREGLGSILLDAMNAGLPIVAKRTGGIPDIISDTRFGRLVEPADDAAFVAALGEFAASSELRQRVGEASRKRALSFSVANMADRYLKVYSQVRSV